MVPESKGYATKKLIVPLAHKQYFAGHNVFLKHFEMSGMAWKLLF